MVKLKHMKDIITKNATPIAIVVAGILVAVACFFSTQNKTAEPNVVAVGQDETATEATYSAQALESLAKCLTQKGAKFYGASWCSWCNKEKTLFGEAVQYLPYVECYDEATQGLTKVCQDAGIQGFPTWEFAGVQNPGYKDAATLAQLSGCELK
jgi:hypothetical protein